VQLVAVLPQVNTIPNCSKQNQLDCSFLTLTVSEQCRAAQLKNLKPSNWSKVC